MKKWMIRGLGMALALMLLCGAAMAQEERKTFVLGPYEVSAPGNWVEEGNALDGQEFGEWKDFSFTDENGNPGEGHLIWMDLAKMPEGMMGELPDPLTAESLVKVIYDSAGEERGTFTTEMILGREIGLLEEANNGECSIAAILVDSGNLVMFGVTVQEEDFAISRALTREMLDSLTIKE